MAETSRFQAATKGDAPASYHPLFPPLDDDPDFVPEKIDGIYVIRHEARGPVSALRSYGPAELPDLSAVAAYYGGGTYELVARLANGRVYARRRYTIDGPSKSMGGEPAADVGGVVSAPAAPGSGDPLAMMLGMMQQSQARSDQSHREMMQMMLAQQASTTQIMVAAMSSGRQDPAALVGAVAGVFAQHSAPQSAPVAPPDPIDGARKMLAFAKEAANASNDDLGKTVSDVAQIAQAVGPMLRPAAPSPTAGTPAARPLPPSTGTK